MLLGVSFTTRVELVLLGLGGEKVGKGIQHVLRCLVPQLQPQKSHVILAGRRGGRCQSLHLVSDTFEAPWATQGPSLVMLAVSG